MRAHSFCACQLRGIAGLHIQVNYPNELQAEELGLHGLFERNEYVDRILTTVMSSLQSQHRKVFFSSKDPDICVLLRYKQSMFPVLLLTDGTSQKSARHLFASRAPSSLYLKNVDRLDFSFVPRTLPAICTCCPRVRCSFVLCLAAGGMTTHKDVRLNSIRNAVEVAKEAGLFGLICNCLPLLQERSR